VRLETEKQPGEKPKGSKVNCTLAPSDETRKGVMILKSADAGP
jgi:hypothetical protein